MLSIELNNLGAMLLAKSVKDLYANATLANYRVNENGFSYLFSINESISLNDLPKILKQMYKNIDRNYRISYSKIEKSQALNYFSNNKYKQELVNEIPDNLVNVLNLNDECFDICQDLHIEKFSSIKVINLFNVSGEYWKNLSTNEQLICISGVCFNNQTELDEFLKEFNERKERDHRKIGADLELFSFDQLAGQGLPIWLPNGTTIKYEIEKYIHDLLAFNGYKFVQTPILGSKQLYEISGHWQHYRENMFAPIQIENEILVLRPMTCPHHLLLYKQKKHSYRELPYRFAEHAFLHRYESSGSLTGLERVRAMQLVDTHLVCQLSQIESEVKHSYRMIKAAHAALGTQIHSIDLSLHDPDNKEKYFDDQDLWKSAEDQLFKTIKKLKVPFKKVVGEAAFYGPKIDFQVKTSLNRIITVSTIQLDFLLPKRFDLQYQDHDGQIKQPILIHAGIIGTFERYMSILLEQNKGVFPLWLSPIQICIIPVDVNKHNEYCSKLFKSFNRRQIRVSYDNSDERVGKKIRDAQVKKIPYQIVIGDNEISNNTISYREYGKQESVSISLPNFFKIIKNRIKAKQ